MDVRALCPETDFPAEGMLRVRRRPAVGADVRDEVEVAPGRVPVQVEAG